MSTQRSERNRGGEGEEKAKPEFTQQLMLLPLNMVASLCV
jgi:hypothetical protein